MTIARDFTLYDGERSGHLERCRTCAQLTIPSLLPESGADENDHASQAWQSLGARGVNNLSSKLLLSLFPPNEPIVRLILDEQSKQDLIAELGEEGLETEVNTELRSVEDAIKEYMEANKFRTPLYRGMKQLVATGNVLAELRGNVLRIHRLDKYIVQRDDEGNPYLVILKEFMNVGKAKTYYSEAEPDETGKVPIYTQAEWDYQKEKWIVTQEMNEVQVGETITYTDEAFPFIPVVWHRNDEDHYGGGHVEDYMGDLMSFDSLSKAIQDGASLASKIIFLLSRNGTTSMRDLQGAANGDVIYGDSDDLTSLGIEKDRDFSVALQKADRLETELAKCFLMNFSVQRSGERVTAEEIRYLAQELEDTLGGIYSSLLSDLQMPLVKLIMKKLKVKLPKEVKPIMVTGFESLGRNHELRRLSGALGTLGQLLPNGEYLEYITIPELIGRVFNASRVDMSNLVKSEQQVEANRAQERENQVLQDLGPQIAEVAREKANQQQPPQ